MPIEMPAGMDDVHEARPLPEGPHKLRCKSCEETEAADGITPQARFTFVCDEEPKAAPVKFRLTWPKPDDTPGGAAFKRLQLKRAQAMVGKTEHDPFNGEDFLDKTWELVCTQQTLDSGQVVNDIFLPKLVEGEGAA